MLLPHRIFLCLVLLAFIYETVTKTPFSITLADDHKQLSIEDFFADVLRKQVPKCSLLIVKSSMSELEIVLRGDLPKLWSSFSVLEIFSKEWIQNFTLRRYKRVVQRHMDICRLSVIMSHSAPETPKIVESISTKLHMVRLNADRFIFLTTRRVVMQQLVLDEFPKMKIKYKIAVGVKDSKVVKVITTCLFCGDNGKGIVIKQFDEKVVNYFPDYTINMNGHVLRISIPAVKPRVEVNLPYTRLNNGKRGTWVSLFDEFLQVRFNFTYNMFRSMGKDGGPNGGGTGFELPNGTWIGTIGDLVAGNADVGILTAKTPSRLKMVSFTDAYFDLTYLNFITSKGTRVFSPVALLWPFTPPMWIAIITSTVTAFLTFKLLIGSTKCLGMDKVNLLVSMRRGVVSKNEWGFKDQLYFVVTSYLDQDCVMPSFTPLRCFVALWLFFTLIITTVFRSKMVSLLAFPVLEDIPETYQQLAYSQYKVGFLKAGDAAYNVLKASKDPVYVKLVKGMDIITGEGVECIEHVLRKRKHACILYSVSALYLKNGNFSDADIRSFVVAPETTFSIYLGLALEKGSLYFENFNKWISWTTPFRLPQLWEETDMYYNVRLKALEWWRETNQTEKLSHVSYLDNDLTLKHISGAFYALSIGLSFTLLIFIGERLINSYNLKFQHFCSAIM